MEAGGAGRAQFLLLFFALLLLPIFHQTQAAAVETDGQECDGMGRRFCNEAHRAEECPEPCKLKVGMVAQKLVTTAEQIT